MPDRGGVRWPVARLLPALGALLLVAGCGLLPDRSAPVPPWPGGPTPSWQWQLSGPLDPTVDAHVYMLDAFRTTLEQARRLRADGRRLVCTVEVGIRVPSRPDAARFPEGVLGRPARWSGQPAGAPAGRWLDVRQWQVLEPVLTDRFRLCRGKGFVAVLAVGMDGYRQRSGFPLTFDDQLTFNRRVAELARRTGLSPGLANDIDQVLALEPYFDFVVAEECFRRRECDRLLPFVNAGKPVFHVEYDASPADFCVTTVGYGFTSIRKDRDLGVRRDTCPA